MNEYIIDKGLIIKDLATDDALGSVLAVTPDGLVKIRTVSSFGGDFIPQSGGDVTGNLDFTSAAAGTGIDFDTTAGSLSYIRKAVFGGINIGADNTVDFYETDTGSQTISLNVGTGSGNFDGTVTAASFVKTDGTNDQILLADGSTASLSGIQSGSSFLHLTGGEMTGDIEVGNAAGIKLKNVAGTKFLDIDNTSGNTHLKNSTNPVYIDALSLQVRDTAGTTTRMSVDSTGVSAPAFIRSGTNNTSDDILLGDGTTTSLAGIASGGYINGSGESSGAISMPATSTRDKYRVWNSSMYAIGMESAVNYGGLADYAMTFQMNNDADRGFWWGDDIHTSSQGAMALTTDGELTVASAMRLGYGEDDNVLPGIDYTLDVDGTVSGLELFAGQAINNTTPNADQVKLDGYGLIGNRGSLYLTNAGGDVKIGTGATHNANTRLTVGATDTISYNNFRVKTIMPHTSDGLYLYGDYNDGTGRGANISLSGNGSPHIDMTIGDPSTTVNGQFNVVNRSQGAGSTLFSNMSNVKFGLNSDDTIYHDFSSTYYTFSDSASIPSSTKIGLGEIQFQGGAGGNNHLYIKQLGGSTNSSIETDTALEIKTGGTPVTTTIGTDGNITATGFVKSGGTSDQVLLADGTTTTLTAIQGDYVDITGDDMTGPLTISDASVPGQTLFDISGSAGQLFSITDSLEGDLFGVNDISGLPLFLVNSDGTVSAPSLDGETFRNAGPDTLVTKRNQGLVGVEAVLAVGDDPGLGGEIAIVQNSDATNIIDPGQGSVNLSHVDPYVTSATYGAGSAFSTISGGNGHTISGVSSWYSTIGGGLYNKIIAEEDFAWEKAISSTIGGGEQNQIINNDWATIGGGFQNEISSQATDDSSISNEFNTVAGGDSNTITDSANSFVGGGFYNQIIDGSREGSIGGGNRNMIWQTQYGTIGGGQQNYVESPHGTVGGGYYNYVMADKGTVAGGEWNDVYGNWGSIVGGNTNIVNGHYAIAGGSNNKPNAFGETAFGLWSTEATGQSADTWVATDRLFTIGNGTSFEPENRSDALLLLKNGLMTLPSLELATLTAAGGKAVATKEYVDGVAAGASDYVSATNGGTFQAAINVPSAAYGGLWKDSTEVPTKGDLYSELVEMKADDNLSHLTFGVYKERSITDMEDLSTLGVGSTLTFLHNTSDSKNYLVFYDTSAVSYPDIDINNLYLKAVGTNLDVNGNVRALTARSKGDAKRCTTSTDYYYVELLDLSKNTYVLNNTNLRINYIRENLNHAAFLAGADFTGDITVPFEAYGLNWKGSYEVPTKDALLNKIEQVKALADLADTYSMIYKEASIANMEDVSSLGTGQSLTLLKNTSDGKNYLVFYYFSGGSSYPNWDINNLYIRATKHTSNADGTYDFVFARTDNNAKVCNVSTSYSYVELKHLYTGPNVSHADSLNANLTRERFDHLSDFYLTTQGGSITGSVDVNHTLTMGDSGSSTGSATEGKIVLYPSVDTASNSSAYSSFWYGTDDTYKFQPRNKHNASLDFNNITSDQTFVFPATGGTIALTGDITTALGDYVEKKISLGTTDIDTVVTSGNYATQSTTTGTFPTGVSTNNGHILRVTVAYDTNGVHQELLVTTSQGGTSYKRYTSTAGSTLDWSAWEKVITNLAATFDNNVVVSGANLKVYDNKSSEKILLENGAGYDVTMDFLITGVRRWTVGIDDSDGDSYKFSSLNGLGSGADVLKLHTNTDGGHITVMGGGNFGGDLKVEKSEAKLILESTNGTPTTQGLQIRNEPLDTSLPGGSAGAIVIEPSATNTGFSQADLVVAGDIYAGNSTITSANKVWHAGDFSTPIELSSYNVGYAHVDKYYTGTIAGTTWGNYTSSHIGLDINTGTNSNASWALTVKDGNNAYRGGLQFSNSGVGSRWYVGTSNYLGIDTSSNPNWNGQDILVANSIPTLTDTVYTTAGSTTSGAFETDDTTQWWLKLSAYDVGIHWDTTDNNIDIRNTYGENRVNGSRIVTVSDSIGAIPITGNSGGTSGTWTGSSSDITSYYDGLLIRYDINTAGATTTTLNINSLGAKTVYRRTTSKITTHFPVGSSILLVYDSTLNSGNGGWKLGQDYYDSTNTYETRWSGSIRTGSDVIHGYQLLVEGVDGKFYPVTVGGSTANTNTVQTASLKLEGTMLYYDSATDVAANSNLTTSSLWLGRETGNMEYWNNRDSGWAVDGEPVYLVGTVDSTGAFTLDNSTFTSFLTQTEPTSEDGKVYVQIGFMDDTYDQFRLQTHHPAYHYKNGGFRRYLHHGSLDQDAIGAVSDGTYWGLANPDGTNTNWIRTGTLGIIPDTSGSGSGQPSIGTSSWKFYRMYASEFIGSLTGNASTASSAAKWTTARTLSLTGDVTGSVSIDGSGDVSITTAVGNNNHSHTMSNISDLPTGFGKTATAYTAIATGGWDIPVGGSIFSQSGSVGGPGEVGYWFMGGRRDTAGGYSGLYLPYHGESNNAYFGTSSDSGDPEYWHKIYTDRNFVAGVDYQPAGNYLTSLPSHGLNNHSDVNISSVGSGEILRWNGSNWVNATLSEAGIQPSGSYLTAHPNISGASNSDNSGGTVIQDLTFDSNGHVTGRGTTNLDNRYLRKDTSTDLTGGGLTISGSIDSGATDMGYYQSAGTNLILKGDSNGRSGIFFQSEKNGTNINHGTDYGFIQYHPHGYGNTSGETAHMVIGVANDSTDQLVLQAPYSDGFKVLYKNASSGTGGTKKNIWHEGRPVIGAETYGIKNNSNSGFISAPKGAYYQSTASSVTGAFKIALPTASYGQGDMMSFEVQIFDYAGGDGGGESVKFLIQGYNYQTSNVWVNTNATVLTTRSDKDYNVRFGHDGTRPCVWIGETGSTWSYPQLQVMNVCLGYTANTSHYDDGWDITAVTSFNTIDHTVTDNYPVARGTDYLFSGATVGSGPTRLVWGFGAGAHSGTGSRNYLAPRNAADNAWDYGQEFGYDHDGRYWYSDAGFWIRRTGDGAVLQRFNTERPWTIIQHGTGASSALGFKDQSGGKSIKILSNANVVGIELTASGNIIAAGNGTFNSDVRIKTNIERIDNALDKLMKVGGYVYDRTDRDLRQNGVLAHEIEAVLPEAVVTSDDEIKTKSVAYQQISALLIEGVKELKTNTDSKVKELTEENEILRKENEILDNKVDELTEETTELTNRVERLEEMLKILLNENKSR